MDFDIIHAHDWMTFKAAIKCQNVLLVKPLIVHIHATEYDRSGGESLSRKFLSMKKWA